MLRGRGIRAERGETLLELVISITILGTAVVAIATGMALSSKVSDVHRKQAIAAEYLHTYAESIENTVATSGYASGCSTPYAYPAPVPAKFSNPTMDVSYFDGTGFPGACNAAADVGLQQLTLHLTSSDNRVSEQLVIEIRKPCTAALGGPAAC